MKTTLIEPFYTGSHAAWAEGYAKFSRHNIEILSLSGNHWKWRMHGGAVTLADKFIKSGAEPDIILASDMLDLSTFLALTRRQTSGIPAAVYFHENQICYPWSPDDQDVSKKQESALRIYQLQLGTLQLILFFSIHTIISMPFLMNCPGF